MNRDIEILKAKMRSLPVDVEGAIREYGIDYEEKELPKGVSGMISYDSGRFRISVEKRDAPVRKRFTAAHELAHYLLHGSLLSATGNLNRHEDVLYEVTGQENPAMPLDRAHEVEANKLAAKILMPASYLQDKYDITHDNVAKLAADLGVSRAALEIRLKTLGLRN